MSSPETMRLDRLLVFLRFARTRSIARTMIESGSMRLNGNRVTKVACEVAIGDVITFARGTEICVARVQRLPPRRLSPAEASRAWAPVT
ncbi:MAG: S4 domain-containing protein [Erythrobacter sp.]